MTTPTTATRVLGALDDAYAALDWIRTSKVGGEVRAENLAISTAAANYVAAYAAIRQAEAIEENTAALLQLADLLRLNAGGTATEGMAEVKRAVAAAKAAQQKAGDQ